MGAGKPVAPAVRLNESEPADSSKFAFAAEPITSWADAVSETGGDSESVIAIVKLEVPAAAGMPLICPLTKFSPAGSAPPPMVNV